MVIFSGHFLPVRKSTWKSMSWSFVARWAQNQNKDIKKKMIWIGWIGNKSFWTPGHMASVFFFRNTSVFGAERWCLGLAPQNLRSVPRVWGTVTNSALGNKQRGSQGEKPRELRTMCDVWEGSKQAMWRHSGRISWGGVQCLPWLFMCATGVGILGRVKGAAKEETWFLGLWGSCMDHPSSFQGCA